MILDTAVLALTGGSVLTSGAALASAGFGAHILAHWDLGSGSELQLRLERRTYLISTLLYFSMAVEILSLFLFVHQADRLQGRFVGAMCAAGTLNVNPFGYPTLFLKLANALLCGLWIILNRTDQTSEDYPLMGPKYRVLRWMAGSLSLEAVLQGLYFLEMEPQLVTSCCGALFGSGAQGLVGDLGAIPPGPAKVVLFVGMALLVRFGIQLVARD
ncbi:MAG: hypothetical protein ACUVS3_01985 [Thermodesulfobacteriota bacterium]